jgi:hypothetical protein
MRRPRHLRPLLEQLADRLQLLEHDGRLALGQLLERGAEIPFRALRKAIPRREQQRHGQSDGDDERDPSHGLIPT